MAGSGPDRTRIRGVEVQYLAPALGSVVFFGFVWMGFGLLPLVVPTGSPPTRRWRWVAWAGIGSLAIGSVALVLAEGFCWQEAVDGSCLRWVTNAIGISGLDPPLEGPLAPVFIGGWSCRCPVVSPHPESGGGEPP